MCIFLFVGSTVPLPVDKWNRHNDWDEPLRSIFIIQEDLSPDILAIFSSRHVYTVGTHITGDGCGFQGEHPIWQDAREDLSYFLEESLELALTLEMFIAGHDFGDSGVRPLRYDQIGPTDVRAWMSGFIPESYILIVPDE